MLLDQSRFYRLCAARDMLAASISQASSIREAARTAGMSPFHFIRQFEALFGSTPHQFRIERRMDHAKRLLASRELSVTETCFEVGMSSLGSFCTLFRERVGVTPSTFQRRAKMMIQVPGQLPLALFPGCFSLMRMFPADAFLDSRNAISEKPERIASL